ncbi:MAG: ROK family protein [Candidatus Hatepunaea meridiana]|nr:ROK family protein [Candidatus Hatepunaea meridiana]
MNESLAIGIDIGGTRIKAALVDMEGGISDEINEPSLVNNDYSEFLNQLVNLVSTYNHSVNQKLCQVLTPDTTPLLGVGLAVAGLMDEHQKTVIDSPNCTAIIDKPLAGDLNKRISIRTVMDNDASAMAIGEGLCGAARGSRHYIALTLGTGIGGAVISDGRLIRGVDGGGGELGHIPIDRRGPRCGCGSRGCIEAYLGRAGIRRYINRNLPQFKGIGMKALSETAHNGDETARSLFAYIGKTLGIAVAGLVDIFNPELVIIGGGISASAELIIEPLKEEVHKRAFKSYLKSLDIRPAKLGNWAGVIGAAAMLRKNVVML